MILRCPICGFQFESTEVRCTNCGTPTREVYERLQKQLLLIKNVDYSEYTTAELDELFEFEQSGTGYALREYLGMENRVFVPNRYKGRAVNSISPNAFEASDVTEVYLPASIREIGHDAFSNCYKLVYVLIPERCKYIGAYAFNDCNALEAINIPDSVDIIEHHAFSGCVKLSRLRLPDTLESIKAYSFENCTSLPFFICPLKLKDIASYAFLNCSGLGKIKFNEGLVTISDYAFSGCSALERLLLPDSLIAIEEDAFHGCIGLRAVSIGASLLRLQGNCFYGCDSLQKFQVRNNPLFYTNGNCIVETKGNMLVVGCRTTVIPHEVISIASGAFSGYSFNGRVFIPLSVRFMEGEAVFNNTNFVVYTEYETKPDSWNSRWILGDNKVIWGAKQ